LVRVGVGKWGAIFPPVLVCVTRDSDFIAPPPHVPYFDDLDPVI
jgi:hypothetical protein